MVNENLNKKNGVKLNELYENFNLNPKNDFGINLVYYILNPIFSNYFDVKTVNEKYISPVIKKPIFYISRHYDEIDILCQQKISKEVRNKYPNYLVKKDLAFLDNLNFGILPYYRGSDKKELIKTTQITNKEIDKYNSEILFELIPNILSSGQDFLIYPEGTRRKGKKFRIQNTVLEDIINIYNITKNEHNTVIQINSVDYKREDERIYMKFGEPLIRESKDLELEELREYLYSNINY